MNIIYSAIIILIVSSNLFGQSLNDLIVTKNQDSIRCKITLVNDDNIFYQYKKKRNIKTDYISRELVLDFQGSNLDLITVKRKEFKIYNKCDTCNNWIVDYYGDTIFYNLNVKYVKIPLPASFICLVYRFKEDSALIESVVWKDSNTTINYNICDLKFASWNGVNYFTFKPDFRYEHSNVRYMCERYLGYYAIKNKTSLIRYSSVYESQKVYSNSVPYLSSYIRTTPEYCIEIGSERIMIPRWNRRKHFRIAMMEVLHKDKKLVERIKNKEFEYEDIEKIINIYNQDIE